MRIVILAALLFVTQTSVAVPRKAPKSSAQTPQNVENQSKNKETPTNFPHKIEAKDRTPSTDTHGEEQANHAAEHSEIISKLPPVTVLPTKRDWVDWGYWVFSLLLVIVGAAQAYLLMVTFGAIKRQPDILQKQSRMLVGKERPRIFVEFEKGPEFRSEGMNKVRYSIECLCPTPAFVQSAEVEAWIEIEGTMPSIQPSMPLTIPKFIKETVTLSDWTPIFKGQMMSGIKAEELGDAKNVLYCRGVIDYRGVHLSPEEPSYRTPFYKKWTPQSYGIPGMEDSGYWEDYPNSETNRNS